MTRLLVLAAFLSSLACAEGLHREIPVQGLPPLVLARGGRAVAEIVVPPPATPVSRFAARELKRFLDAATGGDFPVRDSRSGTAPAIVVGGGAWLPAWGIDTESMARDAFAMRRHGDLLVIAGRDDPLADPERALDGGVWGLYFERGTLFGAYHLLERFAGIRFYFPGPLGTAVPACPDLEIPAVSVDEAPDFPIRDMSWYHQPWFGGASATAALRAQNLHRLRLRGSTAHVPNCHGLARLGLAERFAATHPEYFALLRNGRRDSDLSLPGHHGHLCYSSPGLADEILRDARAFLLGQPAAMRGARCRFGPIWDQSAFRPGFFNIMPQDGHGPANFCRCPDCAPRYDAGRSSDVVWDFIAGVARRLQQEGTPGEITSMAYASCLAVPQTAIPANVRVMVALTGPWSERDQALLDAELGYIDGWNGKLAGRRVWLWNYLNNYAGQIPAGIPPLCPRAVSSYYRRLAGRIDGAFIENEVDSFLPGHLNWTVAMRTLWNAGTEVEPLLAEHHRLMYGPASAAMTRLHDLLESQWMRGGLGKSALRADGFVITPPTDSELWHRIYGSEFLSAIDRHLEESLAAVPSGSLERQRVELFRDEVLAPMRSARARFLEREADISDLRVDIPALPTGCTLDIDGIADEPAWREASAFGLAPLGDATAAVHTRVRALWSPDWLYLAIFCEEPRMQDLARSPRRNDDPLTWQDSSLEIFLDPDGTRRSYRQIIIGAGGCVADVAFTEAGTPGDWAWQSGAQAAVRDDGGGWTAEIAIPAAACGNGPLAVDRDLTANLVRSRLLRNASAGDNQLSSWSPFLDRGFHQPDRFGRWMLKRGMPRNQLAGGSFEQAVDGIPEGWRPAGDRTRFAIDTDRFRDGGSSLRVAGGCTSAQLAQALQGLRPGSRCRLSFWARAEQVAQPGLAVMALGRAGPLAITTPALTGSFPWSRFSLTFTVPAQAEDMVLRITASHPAGLLWLDGFALADPSGP